MLLLDSKAFCFKYKQNIKIIYTTKKRPDFSGRFYSIRVLMTELSF